MQGWETDGGATERFWVRGAVSMPDYIKFFSEDWWKSDFMAYGPAAMKMRYSPGRAVLRVAGYAPWSYIRERYGEDAGSWMQACYQRLILDTESQFLWLYFFYQTIVTTETQACEAAWFNMQEYWYAADKAVWIDRNSLHEKAFAINTAINANTDRTSNTVHDSTIAPPSKEYRQFFAALWQIRGVLSRDAIYMQNISARYLTLEDGPAKVALFTVYAARIRTRVTDLYMQIATDAMGILTGFSGMLERNPNIRAWVESDPTISQLLTVGISELFTLLRTSHQHLSTVADVFSDDAARREVGVSQLGALPSSAGQTLANRIKRIAMRQYSALPADDPRKKVADDWSDVLRNGDLLRNPAPDTPAARINEQLRNRVRSIDAGVKAHDAAVANSHPDPQGQRQIPSEALLNRQPPAGGKLLFLCARHPCDEHERDANTK